MEDREKTTLFNVIFSVYYIKNQEEKTMENKKIKSD